MRFQNQIFFKDKDEIIKGIPIFIESNSNGFNTYRNLKLFFNEVFIYLVGFAGNKQKDIKLSDYIEIDSILAIAWAKVIYPDFYKKVQNYVTPFMYHERSIHNTDFWKSSYNFDNFLKEQYQYNDNGEELVVNRSAHIQINLIFDQLKSNTSFINPDAAIKYFRPIIEPYEFTTVEFDELFGAHLSPDEINKNLKLRWEKDSKNVFNDAVRRLKLRKFDLLERLNAALAFMSLTVTNIKPHSKKHFEQDYWLEILSLFENEQGKQDNSQTFIDINALDEEIIKKMLTLWESKYIRFGLESNNEIITDRRINLYYKFFNQSDFQGPKMHVPQKSYFHLFKKIKNHTFKDEVNKIACLKYIYRLTQDYWEGKITDNNELVSELQGLEPVFLNAFFSMITKNIIIPEYLLNDFPIIFHSVRLKLDDILFKKVNTDKLITLFKDNILSFTLFMDRIKDRIKDPDDGCELPEDQCKIAYNDLVVFIKEESQHYGQGYEESLNSFFKIKENLN